jgi:hypothetical protein
MKKSLLSVIIIILLFSAIPSEAGKLKWKKKFEYPHNGFTSIFRTGDSLIISYQTVNYGIFDGEQYQYNNFSFFITDLDGNVIDKVDYKEELDIEIRIDKVFDGKISFFTKINNPGTFIGNYIFYYENGEFSMYPDTTIKKSFDISVIDNSTVMDNKLYIANRNYYAKERAAMHDSAYVDVYDSELNQLDHIRLEHEKIPFEYAYYSFANKPLINENEIVSLFSGPEIANFTRRPYIILAAFELDGTFKWAKKFEDKKYFSSMVNSLDRLDNGHIWIFGYRETEEGEKDCYIIETDEFGNEIWTRYFKYESYFRALYTGMIPCADGQLMATNVNRSDAWNVPGIRNSCIHFFNRQGELVDSILIENNGWSSSSRRCIVGDGKNQGIYHVSYLEPDHDVDTGERGMFLNYVVPDIVSVEDTAAAPGIEVFPNPATDQLNIKFAKKSDYSVRMVDVLGNAVLESEIKSLDEAKINTGKLAKGFYILEIIDASERKSIRKVIIE